ncbi:MAG: hypothetical protein RI897_1973 [Verrucomicrobiota bacterium]
MRWGAVGEGIEGRGGGELRCGWAAHGPGSVMFAGPIWHGVEVVPVPWIGRGGSKRHGAWRWISWMGDVFPTFGAWLLVYWVTARMK